MAGTRLRHECLPDYIAGVWGVASLTRGEFTDQHISSQTS
jgi:hypothetical protein